MKNLIFLLILCSCSLQEVDMAIPAPDQCYLAHIEKLTDATAKMKITTEESFIHVVRPYEGYPLHYTVPHETFGCVSFPRLSTDYFVEIWDSQTKCEILIPALKVDF